MNAKPPGVLRGGNQGFNQQVSAMAGKESIPCYIGKAPCGCAVSAIVDDPDPQVAKRMKKEIIKFMKECCEAGLVVERSNVGWVRANFGHKCGVKP